VIGRQVSHFYIIRLLGSGGMGIVYEAQDTRLPRSVAIKFLKPALSKSVDALRRFKREAKLASSVNHPNICTVLEVDEHEHQSFIVMELLQGRSLKSRMSAGRLALGEILEIAEQVVDALAVAHDQGIIHRDITPANVFLTDSGQVKLLDFGLAKHFSAADGDNDATEDVTAPGIVAGTIRYMAPELLIGGAALDGRCDLFSLGAVLYQMATGAPPFDMAPRNALVSMICNEPHVPLRQLAPYYPVALERIIDTLLAKRPGDRYPSAREVRADLALLQPATPRLAVAGIESAYGAASVAVLPFELIGDAGPDGVNLRDGLAEDISSRLSALKTLRVAPRTSTRHLVRQSVREIGRTLGVDMVLEGTVQRAADRVRVTANLVDAEHERSVLPALTVDCHFGKVLTTQDQVARKICDGLAPALLRHPRERYTPEPQAYHAFKRGQHHWQDCFSGGCRRAIEHFEYAIERDPQFAHAHVALANAYNFAGFYSLMKPGPSFSVAAKAAERALAIDGTLAPAYREQALAKFGGEWDWDGSESAFRRALALDDSDGLTHVQYSWLLILLGRDDAAIAEAQRGQALAPTSRLVATSRAQTLYIGGRYEEAIEICGECLHSDPTYVFALHLRGLCYLVRSMRAGAVADLEQAAKLGNRAPFYLGLLGRCYGQFGMRAEALRLVSELQEQSRDTYVPPQCYVFIYAGLGEQERALAYQEDAYADGASPFNYLTPSMRDLYALDPYHKRRLQQMRLNL
jgi:serine/threonine protein kinase/tetratricopeptide (TPR) repeat protein